MSTIITLPDHVTSHIVRLTAAQVPSASKLVIDGGAQGTVRVRGDLEETAEFDLVALRLIGLDSRVEKLLVGEKRNEILNWFHYIKKEFLPVMNSGLPSKIRPCLAKLSKTLEPIVFLVDNRFSLADIALFGVLGEVVPKWSTQETHQLDNISRYYDNLQHHPALFPVVQESKYFVKFVLNVSVEKAGKEGKEGKNVQVDSKKSQTLNPEEAPKTGRTDRPRPKDSGKPTPDSDPTEKPKNENKANKTQVPKTEEEITPKRGEEKSVKQGEEKSKKEKSAKGGEAKGVAKGADVKQDKGNVFSRLEMRVGKIVKVEKHPDAESLYVEEIDLGEGKNRTVVSGLVKFVPIEELQNRMVVVLCNLKPSNMRKVKSEAMVICASNTEHTAVEVLNPPAGSIPGDKIQVDGDDGEPDSNINLSSKGNIFTSVLQPLLKTNEEGIAVFDGKPLKTTKGTLSVPTLKNAHLG